SMADESTTRSWRAGTSLPCLEMSSKAVLEEDNLALSEPRSSCPSKSSKADRQPQDETWPAGPAASLSTASLHARFLMNKSSSRLAQVPASAREGASHHESLLPPSRALIAQVRSGVGGCLQASCLNETRVRARHLSANWCQFGRCGMS